MDSTSLKALQETLIELKAVMRDTAEPSVIEQVDEAIRLLQAGIDAGEMDTLTAQKILDLAGKVISNLPSIVALIDLLSR